MSVQQFFNEVEAVVKVLSEFISTEVQEFNGRAELPVSMAAGEEAYELSDEAFAAMWQAVELLSRAYSVLGPMVQFEASKGALVLPDPVTEQPKQPKAARLYDAQGRPLA